MVIGKKSLRWTLKLINKKSHRCYNEDDFILTANTAGLLKSDLKMEGVSDHMNGTGGSQGGSSGRSSPSGEFFC